MCKELLWRLTYHALPNPKSPARGVTSRRVGPEGAQRPEPETSQLPEVEALSTQTSSREAPERPHTVHIPSSPQALATVLKTELFEGDGWIPGLAVADHGVEHNEELPHAGSLSDAGGLALAAEALVKGAKDGVPPGAA